MKKQNSYLILNKTSWKRKEHFEFFHGFEAPFWGLSTQINCTKSYHYCKTYGISFFYYYLYHSLKAINQLSAFRLRIEGNEILEYGEVDGSITVLRPDETFGFAYFNYTKTFREFEDSAKIKINEEKNKKGLKTDSNKKDVIHYSVMPYLAFSQMQHAQHTIGDDSIPKITFGRYQAQGSQLFLPLSIHVHHGLCDGIDVGKFISLFQHYLEC